MGAGEMIEDDYKHVYEIKCHFITYGDKWWLAVVVSFGHVCYWGGGSNTYGVR